MSYPLLSGLHRGIFLQCSVIYAMELTVYTVNEVAHRRHPRAIATQAVVASLCPTALDQVYYVHLANGDSSIVRQLVVTTNTPDAVARNSTQAVGLLPADCANLGVRPGSVIQARIVSSVTILPPWRVLRLAPQTTPSRGLPLCMPIVAKSQLMGSILRFGDVITLMDRAQGSRLFVVTHGTMPPRASSSSQGDLAGCGRITLGSRIVVEDGVAEHHRASVGQQGVDEHDLDCVYGPVFRELSHLLAVTLKAQPFKFTRPRAIVVAGPAGCGKTTLSQKLAAQHGAKVIPLVVTGQRAHLAATFAEAKSQQPSVLLLRAIDIQFPAAEDDEDHLDCWQLRNEIESLTDQDAVVIVATANEPRRISPVLRTVFQDVIEVDLPTLDQRHHLLRKFLPALPESDVKATAKSCQGFSRADVSCLASDTRSLARAEMVPLQTEHLRQALFTFQGHDVKHKDSVGLEAIAGYTDIKERLSQAVIWPYTQSELCASYGLIAPRGVLLYGVEGTGKSLFATAIAAQAQLPLIQINPSQLLSSEVGESERQLRALFRRAKASQPCMMFFDDVQALFVSRSSDNTNEISRMLVSQLALEMDQCPPDVTVIFATNDPASIDQSLLRSGRIEEYVYLPLPDQATRADLLRTLAAQGAPWHKVDIDQLAARLSGRSGADLVALCKTATLYAVHSSDARRPEDVIITEDHFEKTLSTLPDPPSDAAVQELQRWAAQHSTALEDLKLLL